MGDQKCGHCDGEGVCKRGRSGGSCDSCLSKEAIFKTTWDGQAKIVKCNACKGTGWVKAG
jgi:hypothetical protein